MSATQESCKCGNIKFIVSRGSGVTNSQHDDTQFVIKMEGILINSPSEVLHSSLGTKSFLLTCTNCNESFSINIQNLHAICKHVENSASSKSRSKRTLADHMPHQLRPWIAVNNRYEKESPVMVPIIKSTENDSPFVLEDNIEIDDGGDYCFDNYSYSIGSFTTNNWSNIDPVY